jgi:hypothetical protein
MTDRDRDTDARPRNARPRDALGRPLEHGASGVEQPLTGVPRTPAQALREAERLLQDGLPFHAHEVLEDAWKAAPHDERELWRGLAQLAVGATHAARGNRSGALALLKRGAERVGAYEARAPHGIDVAAVLSWAADAERLVTETVPIRLPAPPLT